MFIVSISDDEERYEDLCFTKLSEAIISYQYWIDRFDKTNIGYINKQGGYSLVIP